MRGQGGLLMLSLSSPWYEDRLAGLGESGEGTGRAPPGVAGWDTHCWEPMPPL